MADDESDNSDGRSEALERIARALRGLAYGSVEVTVHDGHVVEIERREKDRMEIPVEVDESSPTRTGPPDGPDN